MVIVVIHDPQTGQQHIHIENGPPEVALGVLKNAVTQVAQELRKPKMFLPNGQTHRIKAEQPPTIDGDIETPTSD
jgi:hypothetical protein